MTKRTQKSEMEAMVEEIRIEALRKYREIHGGIVGVPKKKFDRLGNFRRAVVVSNNLKDDNGQN